MIEERVDESEREREYEVTENRVIIDTDWHQEMDHETFMEVFDSLLNKHRQLSHQMGNLKNQMDEILEEREGRMKILHCLSEDEPQGYEGINWNQKVSVSNDDIKKFHELKKMEKQRENVEEQLEDIKEDIDDMAPHARELAEKHEEMEFDEDKFKLVQGELE